MQSNSIRSIVLFTITGIFIMAGHVSSGQERVCLSHEHELGMRTKYPELGTVEEFEDRLADLIDLRKRSRINDEVKVIPLIIHVVHDNETLGSGANLSADLIYAQIDQLNADFRRLPETTGYNDNPVGADTFIEFAPALIDPDGNILEEPGINRIDRNDMNWSSPPYPNDNYIDNTIKVQSHWDPDLYFNFWSMDLGEELLGYAQFPNLSGLGGLNDDEGDADTDGVVVSAFSIGSSDMPNPLGGTYDEGRTATHEIGHWLGLRHIWGDGGCNVDDYVTDTPEQGASTLGCPTGQESCGSVDMIENYMDYSYDACMNIFTQGQRDRMETVLSVSPRRASLLSSKVHLLPFPNLIISEVMDGDEDEGNPKYIELYNTGDETYDLSSLSIRVYADGSTSHSSTVELTSGTMLAGHEAYVIANVDFDASWGGAFTDVTPDRVSASISGNGNDAYELYDNDSQLVVDVFGVIGTDGTGEDWEYTDGHTVRNSYILSSNAGIFSAENWTFAAYDATKATPGSHTAEVPATDATLVEFTEIFDGQVFNGCDGLADVYAEVVILNSGTGDLSSIDLEVTLDGASSIVTATFDQALASGESSSFPILDEALTQAGDHTLSVEINDPNDGDPTNNEQLNLSFSTAIEAAGANVTVEILTDEYPEETSWAITDDQGMVVADQDSFLAFSLSSESFCLPDGSYTYTLTDSWGDGIFDEGYGSLYIEGVFVASIPGDHPDFDNSSNSASSRSVSFNFDIPYDPYIDIGININTPTDGDFSYCLQSVPLSFSIVNNSNVVLSSAEISYGLSGSLTTSELRNFFLEPESELQFTYTVDDLPLGASTLEVHVNSVNGSVGDENASNDSDVSNVNLSLSDDNGTFISVFTDQYEDETSWEVKDSDGNVLYTNGDLAPQAENQDVLCLPDGDYTFAIYDTYGDGISVDAAVVISDVIGNVLIEVAGDFGTSTSVDFTLPFGLPQSPTNLNATLVSSTEVSLSWTDNSDDETGFEVQRSDSGSGPWTDLGATASNTTGYSDTGVSIGTYYYQVRAANDIGKSEWSDQAQVILQTPDAPSNLAATAIAHDQVSLSWTDNSDIENTFNAERAESVDGPWTNIATTSADTEEFSDVSLSQGTTYYYRVNAENVVGTSDWSETAMTTTLVLGSGLETNQIKVYPNPVESSLTVSMNEPSNVQLTLSDVAGKIYTPPFTKSENQIIMDMSSLGNGLYFLGISTGQQEYAVRVIKK